MNILWITHEYPPIGGGGATACKALAREFTALGHSVTVVTAGLNNAHLVQSTYKHTRDSGVEIYRLKCRRTKKDSASFFEMLSFLRAAFRVVPRLVKERNADKKPFDAAVISFGIPSGPLGWYLKRRFGLPYIVRLGGGDIPGTQKRFTFMYKLLSPFLKAVWRNASYVVANSRGLQERAERYYDKARFSVICNGVDLKEWGICADGVADVGDKDDNIFRIITTARIVERKGIQHVIEALPSLVEATGGNIRYTVVGDGPYRGAIESLANKLGVSGYVEITGMAARDEVVRRLSEADVFVLTSHWEGMPNAVIEAMAAGLPIIMSDCEGSAELVDSNGYIVKSGNNFVNELTAKILALYNDGDMLLEMGEKSYSRVNKYFCWDKSAEEYLRLISETV